MDARAHRTQLAFPKRAQLAARQHPSYQRRAVRGRAGIDGADDALDLRLHRLGRVRIRTDHRQRAHALAIQREGLGVRIGHDEAVDAGLGDDAYGGAIFRDALVEALVGHVDEGEKAAFLQQRRDLLPLRDGQVGAGGVVAARMQQDHGTGFQPAQVGQHAGEIQAMRGGVEIGVVDDVEAGRAEYGAMVFPAGIADRHRGVRQQLLQQVRAHAQGAAAADGLGGGDAAGGDQLRILAEHQLAGGGVIGRQAVDGQVAARLALGGQGFFDAAHAVEQGDAALLVVVDADAQVDLLGAGIGVVSLGQPQDGVAGHQFDGCKKRHGWGPLMSEGGGVKRSVMLTGTAPSVRRGWCGVRRREARTSGGGGGYTHPLACLKAGRIASQINGLAIEADPISHLRQRAGPVRSRCPEDTAACAFPPSSCPVSSRSSIPPCCTCRPT